MQKPRKTLADYVAVAISPVLIMVLVGSLAFFLIQVFYRGESIQGIRWVMFWFVLAIVLVARIGIEEGTGHARFFGGALAVATWLYLAHTLNTPVAGAILLAITWWCAHRLTLDCTLVSDEEDASGEGVLQGMWRQVEKTVLPQPPPGSRLPSPRLSPLEALVVADLARRRAQAQARPPGRSVVYFSLAALPLFGIGQLFLPADDPRARLTGFAYLALYLCAALSLLMTTSFLGLRRYLRQRSVEMPVSVTLSWIKFGALVITGVLLLALVLPRPDANKTLKDLTYRIEHKKHKATEYALRFNPPGEGEGTPTDQPVQRDQPGVTSKKSSPSVGTTSTSSPSRPPSPPGGGTGARGTEGSPAQGAQSGNNTGPQDETPRAQKQNIRLRDRTPASGGDQGADREQPAGDAGSEGQVRDGPGGKVTAEPQHNPPANGPQAKQAERKNPTPQQAPPQQPEQQQRENTTPAPTQPVDVIRILRILLLLVVGAVTIWLLVRYRKLVAQKFRSFIAVVRDFLKKLFSFRRRKPVPAAELPLPTAVLEPFASYENPFATGKDRAWPPERLLRYTYEAIQAWAKDRGIELQPQQTPREFCSRLAAQFPDFGPELDQFSSYYCHAAFAQALPEDFETESIRHLWQYLGDSVPVGAGN